MGIGRGARRTSKGSDISKFLRLPSQIICTLTMSCGGRASRPPRRSRYGNA